MPPPQMVANMKAGTMDAFCVGEPWNDQLVNQGLGYSACVTGEIWKDHPETSLAMRADWVASRDGAAKIYVQDRMREAAMDLWRWLQDGAHFYVCGDALRMARDVDAALREIAMRQGGLSVDQARDWIVALARQGRYLRVVY